MSEIGIVMAINGLSGNAGLDLFMLWYSQLALVVIVAIALLTQKKDLVGKSAIAIAIGFIIDLFFNTFFFRMRPFAASEAVRLIGAHAADASFPSTHTMVAFAFVIPLWLHNKKLGVTALVLATLVGFSRMYLGLHYATDVLMGAALGLVLSWAAHLLWNKVKKK